MKRILGDGVTVDELNKHAALMIIVYDLLNSQSQPKRVKEVTDEGLVFDLRVNLAKASCESLIVTPLREVLLNYDVVANYETRELSVMRCAESKKQKKPSRSARKEAA